MQKRDNRPKERTAEQALQTLQWVCSRMERCRSDIRRSLYSWSVPQQDWEGIIAKLESERYIDDERYAAAYVREKSRLSGWGKAKIVSGLRAKNIDCDIITRAIEECIDEQQSLEQLEDFIVNRIKRDRPKSKNEYDLRQRVFRAAAAKGFDFDLISSIIDRCIK